MSRITIRGDIFKDVQKALALHVRTNYGTDDILNRVHYEIENNVCTCVALDGYTMAVISFSCSSDDNCSFELPVIKTVKGLMSVDIVIDTEITVIQKGLSTIAANIIPIKGTFVNYQELLDRTRNELLDKNTVLRNVDCYSSEYLERVGKSFRLCGIKNVYQFFSGTNLNATVFTGSDYGMTLLIMVLPMRDSKIADIRF